ncbi:MAG: NUDIX hydrolase [Leptospiraceae bacterium]|nr:NUDIX hydrolase [Leptospiraceae bacterium]
MSAENHPSRLPLDQFLKSFEWVPRVAVNVLIQTGAGVLLTRRETEPHQGCWHFPGGFILKNERMEAALRRIAQDELDLQFGQYHLTGVFENLEGDPRGHIIDLVYHCNVDTDSLSRILQNPAHALFLSVPDGMGFGQEQILNALGITG